MIWLLVVITVCVPGHLHALITAKHKNSSLSPLPTRSPRYQCDFLIEDIDEEFKVENLTSRQEMVENLTSLAGLRLGLGPDNKTIQCADEYCFSVWKYRVSTGHRHRRVDGSSKQFIIKGCYRWNDLKNQCSDDVCKSRTAGTHKNGQTIYMCCCKGTMCNMMASDPIMVNQTTTKQTDITDSTLIRDVGYTNRTILIAIGSVAGLSLVVILVFLTCRIQYRAKCRRSVQESLSLLETATVVNFDLEDLKISSQIYRGRYADVWRASLGDLEVAVKMFSASQKQHYLNEKGIYLLPLMEHENIVKFYGTQDECVSETLTRYSIVLEYVPLGSLTNYLKNNTFNWLSMCRMCHGIISGLSHLHLDSYDDGKVKPAIAHRDFNSRNILVKSDLTCVLADFGFSMQIHGSRYYKGPEESAEPASLTDVGTLRYMAPEVLDGAVNLRDCEASLKQIDVYSLGLVIWELASRCTDLYQGLPVPEYKLPYQSEVGQHPSIEEMQILVSRDKKRPIFPDVWKDSNQAIRAVKETIEDCWDHDAEARLTAPCALERVLDLQVLWEARLKGLAPTALNPNMKYLDTLKDRVITQENPTTERDLDLNPADGEHLTTTGHNEQTSESQPCIGKYTRLTSSVSDSANTMETTLTMSPDQESTPFLSKDDVNLRMEEENKNREPVQGRNQIVDRNTHKNSSEELTFCGNCIDGTSWTPQGKCDINQTARALFAANDEPANTSRPGSVVTPPPVVSHYAYQRPPNNPIPYLQNQVHCGDSLGTVTGTGGYVLPKQDNVPGNGTSTGTPNTSLALQVNTQIPKESALKNKLKAKLSKERLLKLLPSFLSRNHNANDEEAIGDNDRVIPHGWSVLGSGPGSGSGPGLEPKPHPQRDVDTLITIVNGNAVVSTSNQNQHPRPPNSSIANGLINHDTQRNMRARLGMAQVGVAKAKVQHTNHGSPLVVHRLQHQQPQAKSDTVNDLSNATHTDIDRETETSSGGSGNVNPPPLDNFDPRQNVSSPDIGFGTQATPSVGENHLSSL